MTQDRTANPSGEITLSSESSSSFPANLRESEVGAFEANMTDDNSMVAITPTKVHQPPFLREYESNATCACHGEASGHSIEHCRTRKHKVQGLIDAG